MADIGANDYNLIHQKLKKVLGSGVASFGYGQTVVSSPVATNQGITKAQWDLLRFDILNARIHQDGTTPIVRNINVGDVIGEEANDPKVQYNNFADLITGSRFELAPSQSTITAISTKTTSQQWNVGALADVSVTFNSADEARFFFNSGGQIRFTSSRAGGTESFQNTAWTQMLDTAGTIPFSANPVDAINFYTLTNTYQTFFQIAPSGSYSYLGTRYTIEVKCDVANNINGGATVVDFRVLYLDPYDDPYPGFPPPDLIDGTLTLNVEEVKASGVLQPVPDTGDFSVAGPASYSVSEITVIYNAPPSPTPAPPPPPPPPIPPPPPPPISPPAVYNETVSADPPRPGDPAGYYHSWLIYGWYVRGGAPNSRVIITDNLRNEVRDGNPATSFRLEFDLDAQGNYSDVITEVYNQPITYYFEFPATGNTKELTLSWNPYTYRSFALEYADGRENFESIATTIGDIGYKSSSLITNFGGLNWYGLARNPDVNGLLYWTNEVINRYGGDPTNEQFQQAFFNSTTGEDRERALLPSKPFIEFDPNAPLGGNLPGGDFYDK